MAYILPRRTTAARKLRGVGIGAQGIFEAQQAGRPTSQPEPGGERVVSGSLAAFRSGIVDAAEEGTLPLPNRGDAKTRGFLDIADVGSLDTLQCCRQCPGERMAASLRKRQGHWPFVR